MTVGELSSTSWQILTTDLFHFKGCNYLLLVDYYSHFFETAKLSDTTTKTIICLSTLNLFCQTQHPQCTQKRQWSTITSDKFKQFSSQWGFSHISVSPYHPQANGLTEKYLHIIKTLLTKASETNQTLISAYQKIEIPSWTIQHHQHNY